MCDRAEHDRRPVQSPLIAAPVDRTASQVPGGVTPAELSSWTPSDGNRALAVLDAERGKPGANITTFGDAIWWAMTTITTVGYGDRYRTTAIGRLAAAGLMIGGIALLGVVTATLASWLIEQVAETEDEHWGPAAPACDPAFAIMILICQLGQPPEPHRARVLALPGLD
jgi:hypothetical protein